MVHRFSLLALAAAALGCKSPAPESAAVQAGETSPDSAFREPSTPSNVKDALAPSVDAATSEAATTVDAAADVEVRQVPRAKVVSIGMHVGGGPFDELTKQPFLRAVEPRYAELARCFDHVTQPRQGDAGVDLTIEAGGGRAQVKNPRTTLKGEKFVPCVVAFFESVEFDKSPLGKKVVSYSVRFIPLP